MSVVGVRQPASRFVGWSDGGVDNAAAAVSSSYPAAIAAEASLVAYYKLDDTTTTAVDSKAARNGTLSGTYTQSVTGPLTGSSTATTFGGGQCLVAHAAALALTSNMSFEAFLKPTATGVTGTRCYVNKTSGTGVPAPYDVHLEAGKPRIYLGDGGSNFTVWEANATLTAGVWTHVVWTMTTAGSTPICYVNGASQTVALIFRNAADVFADTAHALYIGYREASPTVAYDGGEGHVALYSAVLSAASVAAHYAAR